MYIFDLYNIRPDRGVIFDMERAFYVIVRKCFAFVSLAQPKTHELRTKQTGAGMKGLKEII